MRKRKRGYGSYVDEDTGQVTTVQTTKQAKRIHQKSGKWYKEPTAQELRIWDREAKQKAAAERSARREENKKTNAAKRAEKEAKELGLKQEMFMAGKITFTQTLAKKDSDQMNLHSWFGGKPQQPKSKKEGALSNAAQYGDKDKDREDITSGDGDVAHGSTGCEQVRQLSQEFDEDSPKDSKDFYQNEFNAIAERNEEAMAEPINQDDRPGQVSAPDDDTDLSQTLEDFDIREDSDIEPDESDTEPQQVEQKHDSLHEFKVPALPAQRPQRPPLSPMSKSDVNIRNSQTGTVSSFKAKLAASNLPTPVSTAPTNVSTNAAYSNIPSTQAVRDLLSGLCTQDLADDDLDVPSDKENEGPGSVIVAMDRSPTKFVKHSSPLRKVETIKPTPPALKTNKSFTSLTESFDGAEYDNIFAELGTTDVAGAEAGDEFDDFDDGGLDDATLLSLPATQLCTSILKPALSASDSLLKVDNSSTTPVMPESTPVHNPPKPSRKPLKHCDSFAIDGLSDDDLLEGLEEYERSQKLQTPGPDPTPVPVALKKKRTLPWEKHGWGAETTGGQFNNTPSGAASGICSQETDVMSSWD